MAFIAEICSKGHRYLAIKSSDGKKILRWIGRDYSVRDIRKAVRDFKIDLTNRRTRRQRRGSK